MPSPSPASILNNKLIQEVANIYVEAEAYILKRLSENADRMINDNSWYRKKFAQVSKMNADIQIYLKNANKAGTQKIANSILTAYTSGYNAANKEFGVPHTLLNNVNIPPAITRLLLETSNLITSNSLYVLRKTNDVYRELQAINSIGILTGIDTRREASQRLLNDLADKGIKCFVDKAGRQWSLSAYTEMAMRTVSHRAMLQGHTNRIIEMDRDLVIVSSHGSCCKLCAPWEGTILSLTGKTPGYPTIKEAIAAGLFHPNCKHSVTAYIEGLTRDIKPHYNPEEYEYQCKQRYNERQIRRWKLRENAALSPKEKLKAKRKVRQWQSIQRKTLEEASGKGYYLRRDYGRESIKGITVKPLDNKWKVDIVDNDARIKLIDKPKKVKSKPKKNKPTEWVPKGYEAKSKVPVKPDLVTGSIEELKQRKYSVATSSLVKTKVDKLNNLAKDSIYCLKRYTDEFYDTVNRYKRGITKKLHREDIELVKDMEKAFKTADKIGKDTELFRTMRLPDIVHMADKNVKGELREVISEIMDSTYENNTKIETLQNKLNKKLRGAVISDKGYVSTSRGMGNFGNSKNLHFEIQVPKETKCFFVENISKYPNEKEVILNAGTNFYVTGAEIVTDSDGDFEKVIAKLIAMN